MSLLALIGACALQAAIIALVQYYGIVALRPIQPLLATIIPPIAWFAFTMATEDTKTPDSVLWHLVGPALAIYFLASNPPMLDVLIPIVFTAYGIAIVLRLRGGEDSLQYSRLESGAAALIAWRIVAAALIASAACDVLIAYTLASGQSGFLGWAPSLVSSASLLSLGILGLSSATESRRDIADDDLVLSPDEIERDSAILDKLDRQLIDRKDYLNPDLTLARLARRISVPAKQLSSVINRCKKENVSRYINRLRVEEACVLMHEGKSITAAMLDAGFNTKSNFNREFLRIKGKSPSRWINEDQKKSAT